VAGERVKYFKDIKSYKDLRWTYFSRNDIDRKTDVWILGEIKIIGAFIGSVQQQVILLINDEEIYRSKNEGDIIRKLNDILSGKTSPSKEIREMDTNVPLLEKTVTKQDDGSVKK
jgi:homoserine trans-succinylase